MGNRPEPLPGRSPRLPPERLGAGEGRF